MTFPLLPTGLIAPAMLVNQFLQTGTMRMRSRTGVTIAACSALIFALMALSVRQHWWHPASGGVALVVPLLGLGQLDVNISGSERSTAAPPGWLPTDFERRFAIPTPLTVDLWLRSTTRDVRLLRMQVPAWPLALLSAVAGAAAVWLWPRRPIVPR